MNGIVFPLYMAFACLFLGLTLASQPGRDKRLQPGERPGLYGVWGGLSAALACVCIALVPWIGRSLLALSTLLLWASFLSTGLRVRSWHTTVTRQWIRGCMLAMVLLVVLMAGLMVVVVPLSVRVLVQLAVSLALLVWLMSELRSTQRQNVSSQLDLMMVCSAGLQLVLSLWSWFLLSGHHGQVLSFSALFSEALLPFAMRLFLVSLLALLLIGANGYGLEWLVRVKSSVSDQKAHADRLNQQLNQWLNEKNEMLQALSYAARSENLPAIMSSLSHEINQPLGVIRLNADHLLAEDATLDPKEREQLLQQLVIGSITATQVVRDFRRFLETNLSPHVSVDLVALLADLVRGSRTEFSRQKVAVSLSQGPAARVLGDPIQLESALMGALQYMLRRGTGHPRTVSIDHTAIGRFVHVRILDDSSPLSQAMFDQAFVRSTSDSTGHFSQSLWLSRAIVEHHGGSMGVHEENGRTGIGLQLPMLEEKS